jgi:predicted DNA-binding transcriptional regulator YafY
MYHAATRLLTVLELLQSRQRVGGADLARRLEVDERTVRRYVTMLRDLGIPDEAARGRYGAYRLRPGYKLPPLMFTDEEALAVVLGLLAARQMGLTLDVAPTEAALAKFERVLPASLRERVQAVSDALTLDLRTTTRTPASDIVLTVSLAAREQRQVWLRYRSGGDDPCSRPRPDVDTERLFDPYGVVYRAGRWYTAGHCHLRDDTRLFRLDRVVEAQIRDDSFTRPDDFDCLAYVIRSIALLPGRYDLDVLIHTTLEEARSIILLGVGTVDEVEGGVALRGYTQDVDWLARYLAGLPWAFEVRRPDELRDALRRHAAAMIAAAGLRTGPASPDLARPRDGASIT